MKAVLFNGSPRANGNTFEMLKTVAEVLRENNIKTEIVQIGGKPVNGCKACGACFKSDDKRCIQKDDLNSNFEKMLEADAIIIGSPTYYADLTPETKALIDRCGFLHGANSGALKRKLGAAVVAVRRAGSIHVFDSINHFFLINQMIIPGSSYWNMSLARTFGDYEKDEEGIRTMKILGENIAWLLKKIS
ncbi:MAG: flavodoxin family protein [Candidatus Cloacimonetes bacterium]|nr:flavodoxin family protein [Candidatus Cloacimonadota bacterium]MCF7813470.1 flavodoxin family protein [Candidatus Cloacimonadota bacterium]MCF7869172.1 flavodoxin family protein [Candidatus Cloacimonadota bacterium]MCF7883394.1 flavodoxin family protein [Candidatus Cloacimonadota bacterium]